MLSTLFRNDLNIRSESRARKAACHFSDKGKLLTFAPSAAGESFRRLEPASRGAVKGRCPPPGGDARKTSCLFFQKQPFVKLEEVLLHIILKRNGTYTNHRLGRQSLFE